MYGDTTTLKISELPVDVEKQVNLEKGKSILMIMTIFGIICMVTGVLTLIFGPESLMIYGSMSFKEFILLYPGPIASVGFLFVGGANAIMSSQHRKFHEQMSKEYTLDAEGIELPEDVGLMFVPIDDQTVRITLNVTFVDNDEEYQEVDDEKIRQDESAIERR